MKVMNVRLTLNEDILGTLPGDEEIYKKYIASKAPDPSTIEDEVAAIGVDEVYDKGVTVFPRDEAGNACVYNYLIRGFFKNAASAMKDADDSVSKNLKAHKKKIDNLVFVYPRLIPIVSDKPITICERPLRASTPQGERVAISASESIPAGATLEFTIKLLNSGMEDYVKEWLDYGQFNGLGQWHNSGKGAFTWELIDGE